MQTRAHNLLSEVYERDRMERRSRLADNVCAGQLSIYLRSD
jgi:hypothetical protein